MFLQNVGLIDRSLKFFQVDLYSLRIDFEKGKKGKRWPIPNV